MHGNRGLAFPATPHAISEPLLEEEQLLNVRDALQRIEHLISERRKVVTGQLKGVQMHFTIEMEQGRATQDSNSGSDRGHRSATPRSVFSPALHSITMETRCEKHPQMECRTQEQWHWSIISE